MSFLDRKEIKDILCYWRLVLNTHDDTAARRIVNWPARGIGRTALERVHQHAVENKMHFFESLQKTSALPPKAVHAVQEFAQLILILKSKLETSTPTPQSLAEWARFSLEQIKVKQAIEDECDEPGQAAKRWENLEELAHSLGQIRLDEFEGKTLTPSFLLREFLTRLTLDAQEEAEDDQEKKKTRDEVTLMTLHSAKGLEFPVVFLVGMEEGLLPHQRVLDEATDLSEERRLCYVGITRAKDHLYLTRAKHRIKWGKATPRTLSRFLQEIPPSLMLTRDISLTPDLSSKKARDEHETRVKGFLDLVRKSLG